MSPGVQEPYAEKSHQHRIREFFRTRQFWFRETRNGTENARTRTADSCAAAAAIRNRLGYTGIPLSDELRSYLGETASGKVVALHCRAHRKFDMSRVALAVGEHVQWLNIAKVQELGLAYGLINPFLLTAVAEQYFDEGVLLGSFPPRTMMTNMGHKEWAVEFDPREVLASGELGQIATLVSPSDAPTEHVIGILTGNSPESGILLWERLIRAVRERSAPTSKGDTAFPRVVVESVPEMGLSMELDVRESAVRTVVLDGVRRLIGAGATLIAVACNTTQYFSAEIGEICGSAGVEFVSLVDEVGAVLEALDARECDLLAAGPASDLDKYSDFRRLTDKRSLRVVDQAGATQLDKVAFYIKEHGATSGSLNRFRDVVNRVADTDVVVLALTELSVAAEMQKRQQSDRIYVDTLDVLAEALADRYLEERNRAERQYEA